MITECTLLLSSRYKNWLIVSVIHRLWNGALMADWRLRLRLRLRLRISFALNLATGISPALLVPVLGAVSTAEVQVERRHYLHTAAGACRVRVIQRLVH